MVTSVYVRIVIMNEFTKEELQIIAEAIPYILHKGVQVRTELLKKIDGMINQCNHEKLFGVSKYIDGELGSLCSKCGKFYR
jgi:hypothetical protein